MNTFKSNTLVGKSKEVALDIIQSNGYTARVVAEDSTSYMVTMDIRMNRVNLQLRNNIVIAAAEY